MQCTPRRHQINEGKRGLETERVRAHGAFCSLRFNKKLGAEEQHEMHFLYNEDKEKWIQDYVERETTGARKRVEHAEAAVQQEKDDTWKAETTRLMNREPE